MARITGKLTNGPEICSYLLAHAVGLGFGFSANRLIVLSLAQRGLRERDLFLPNLATAIVTIAIVLMIFLCVRRAIERSNEAVTVEDAAGFGLGLSAVWFSLHAMFDATMRTMRGGLWVGSPVGPADWWGLTLYVTAAVGMWLGGAIAFWYTREHGFGLNRAARATFLVPLVAFPVAALLLTISQMILLPALAQFYGLGSTYVFTLAFGALAYALPAIVATFLWSLLFFSLAQSPTQPRTA